MPCAEYIGIARQKPDAPKPARLRTWHWLGRFVKRGEQGILLLAPMIGCKKAESAAELTEDAKPSLALMAISGVEDYGGCPARTL
jgi:hypothetical protein